MAWASGGLVSGHGLGRMEGVCCKLLLLTREIDKEIHTLLQFLQLSLFTTHPILVSSTDPVVQFTETEPSALVSSRPGDLN